MAVVLERSLQAVIFDFDGTLADSYAAIAASVNHVRAFRRLLPLTVAEVKRHVGRGAAYLIERTVGAGDVEGDIARYKAHHPSVMGPLTHLLPGAREALMAVHTAGLRAAVCSNKPRAFTLELLASLDIASYFDVVIGPEDAPRPKPSPEMLRLALERLGVKPDQALYVGDMTVDIDTARAAGVAVCVVPTGSDLPDHLRQARPDLMLTDLVELARMFAHRTRPGGAP
jgi:phosphoglycolate phosphatase